MTKTVYQIIEYDKHHNPVVLSSGLTKEIAEYGLRCDNVKFEAVRWVDVPIYNMQVDAEIYRGVVVKCV